jgi:hypothetical protein
VRRRRSIAIVAIVAMAACGRSSARDDAARRPRPADARPADARPAAPAIVVDAAPAIIVDAGPAIAPGPTRVTLTIDGHPSELRYGYVDPGNTGAMIRLFRGPVDCATRNRIGAEPPEFGPRIAIQIEAGPGGRWYAGHPIGTHGLVESPQDQVQVGPLPPMGTTLPISPDALTLTLEPSTWRRGAHVRGTVDGGELTLIGSSSVTGRFDVEVCDDLAGRAREELAVLADAAPAAPARGTIGGRPFVPRTVHAIVRHRPRTADDVVDLAVHRTRGGARHVWMVAFYAEANVPCPPARDDFDRAHPPAFYLQGPGGTSEDHPLLGTQQPAAGILARPDAIVAGVWWAWVRFDALAWETGATVRGALVAQTTYLEDRPQQGRVAGRFTATVCDVE